jgi:hypothetical protein
MICLTTPIFHALSPPEFLASSFKSHAANPTPVLKSLQPRDVDEIAQVLPVVAEWFMIVASVMISFCHLEISPFCFCFCFAKGNKGF